MVPEVNCAIGTLNWETGMKDKRWDIRREGRAWDLAEAVDKLDILPSKLELVRGKLCLDEAQRLVLLAALLENVGLDAAVRLADTERWTQAISARIAEMSASADQSGPAPSTLDAAMTALNVSGSVNDASAQTAEKRSWNYRALAFTSTAGDHWNSIHEVHYEDGHPVAYSERPAVVLWDEADGLMGAFRIVERMKEALLKPALNAADFQSESS
jgi:hypothetical protein